jgi:DNA-binding transcriptional regulator YiaG
MTDLKAKGCPVCRVVGATQKCSSGDVRMVRGESIAVTTEFHQCTACGTEFEFANGDEALFQARARYRQSRSWLSPEQISQWRAKVGLSAEEVDRHLGWASGLMSRYEKGYLQTAEHDAQLRSAMKAPASDLQRAVRNVVCPESFF